LETITTSKPVQPREETPISSKKQPIPPPSHPRQYRAIGLIQGQYTPLNDQPLTKGKLMTNDGTTIDAVILGKVISLIKNHVDFSQSYLWVVYPRTRPESDHLHTQIVGIWQPQIQDSLESNSEGNLQLIKNKSGYFSIRGEVVHYNEEEKKVVVKIRQAPKIEGEKPKFFKLELLGQLKDKIVGYFWDFEVQLKGKTFLIETATNMGRILPQKKQFNKLKNKQDFKVKKAENSDHSINNKGGVTNSKLSSKVNPLERPKRKI